MEHQNHAHYTTPKRENMEAELDASVEVGDSSSLFSRVFESSSRRQTPTAESELTSTTELDLTLTET